MRLLLDLQPKWGWELAIAHCNHGWRSDSTANAEFIQQYAATWNLPFYCATAIDLPPTEAAARQWRYQVLAEMAEAQGYAIVVTGHTLSDRAETLLYNLLRGSGADGLQALTWQRPLTDTVQLVRPLLDIRRSETGEFCQNTNLTIWEDSTNQNLDYARNRIRQELIPYLQTHFNPQVEQALAQTAELLAADVAYLEEVVREVEGERGKGKGEREKPDPSTHPPIHPSTHPPLNRTELQEVPLAIQRRIVRRWLQEVLPTAPGFEQIEKVVKLIDAPNRSQSDPLPGGAIAQVEGDWIGLCHHGAL
jgi:tRNA(Ile)-lysidine synthase